MITRKVVATLGALAAVLASQTALSTPLPDAVSQALSTHPDVQIAVEQKNAIEQEFYQARAGFLPTVDFTAGTGWERSDNATTRNLTGGSESLWRTETRLAATQMLFDGFQTDAETCQQRERYSSAQYNVKEVIESTALRAIDAYLDVLRKQKLLDLAEDNLKTHKRYLDQIKKRAASGRGSDADVRQAQSRVSLIQSNLYTARGELRKAQATYLAVVGQTPMGVVRPEAPVNEVPSSLADALARAMENSPAILSAQHDVQAVEEAVRGAESLFMPKVNFEAAMSKNKNFDGSKGSNDEYSAMVRMQYNLYRGGADEARKKEQLARLEEARDMLERDRREVEENMYRAWSNYEAANERLRPLSQHVTSSNQTRAAYKAQFDIGKRSLLDLLDSEVEFFEAKKGYIDGQYEADLAVYEILATSGDLLEIVNPALEAPVVDEIDAPISNEPSDLAPINAPAFEAELLDSGFEPIPAEEAETISQEEVEDAIAESENVAETMVDDAAQEAIDSEIIRAAQNING